MKKILLTIIAIAGVWMNAGAQNPSGYVSHIEDKEFSLNRAELDHISGSNFEYSNDYGTFKLSGDKSVKYLTGNDKCLDLNKGKSFKYTWTSKSPYEIINIKKFTIKTATWGGTDWGKAYVSINKEDKVNIATANVDKSSDNAYKTVSSSATFTDSNNGISIAYSSLLGNQYICYISYDYQIKYYTLDFAKVDDLISQANTLYNGLSEESKNSANGTALNNAKINASNFKSTNENTAVVIGDQLRTDLTSLENNLQAAINAFTLTLDEASTTYNAADKTATKISVKRTIKADTWNTLCLPFAMDATQIANNFGEAEIMVLKGVVVDNDSYNIKFTASETIPAATPCIIRVKEGKEVIAIENNAGIKLSSGNPIDTKGDVSFVGTYIKQSITQNDNNYIISGDNFYFVNSDITSKGFRGYFHLNTSTPSQVMTMSFEDETDGIGYIYTESKNDGSIYNLAGQRIEVPVRGQMYIMNGKKFIAK